MITVNVKLSTYLRLLQDLYAQLEIEIAEYAKLRIWDMKTSVVVERNKLKKEIDVLLKNHDTIQSISIPMERYVYLQSIKEDKDE